MRMEYKLLCSNIGIITTREPELISGTLFVSFEGAPDGSTAIFEREDGESAYRLLSDGLCAVESDWLRGSIKVTVALLSSTLTTWTSERRSFGCRKGTRARNERWEN